jgi:hypothetical protein
MEEWTHYKAYLKEKNTSPIPPALEPTLAPIGEDEEADGADAPTPCDDTHMSKKRKLEMVQSTSSDTDLKTVCHF